MTDQDVATSAPPVGHPYAEEIEAERLGWYEIASLVRSLTRASIPARRK